MSAVPIVLVQMPTASGRLNFQLIASRVRSAISLQQLETLAPFGIGYDEIEQAYSRLQDSEQIPFCIADLWQVPAHFQRVAQLVEPRLSLRSGWFQPSALPRRPVNLSSQPT